MSISPQHSALTHWVVGALLLVRLHVSDPEDAEQCDEAWAATIGSANRTRELRSTGERDTAAPHRASAAHPGLFHLEHHGLQRVVCIHGCSLDSGIGLHDVA